MTKSQLELLRRLMQLESAALDSVSRGLTERADYVGKQAEQIYQELLLTVEEK